MLPEVLDLIAGKHITCYEDYPSFAGVCKSWRLAAARTHHNSNGPPSRFLSLMLAEKSDDHECCELFLLSNKSIRKIRLPEIYGKERRSSCGWLLTVDTFPEFIYPVIWDGTIEKVYLLMESNLVFVKWRGARKLGFCHIGDSKWTSVVEDNGVRDITFYNGHVYSFDYDDTIRACNVNGKDPTVLVDVETMPEDVYDQDVYSAYIVGLDDGERKQLLVIIKQKVLNDETYMTKSFKVLAYDLESGNWSYVKDFCMKTLFVGYTSSFWMEDTMGVIKGNCIYYTDDGEYSYSEKGGRDMGIYHLSNGTIEPHFTGESCSHFTPPIWLQSM
nr:hypothetical protein [Tanacetum cinerariifolium]